MSGGANIVEQYAGADVPARIELLIKYYPNFIRLVEGYEQSSSFIIKEEKAYARKGAMGDLGVRVQTSGTGDPTAKAAIENVMIMEAIQKGNLESVTSELDEQVVMKYQREVVTIQNMREDYQILRNQFFYLEPADVDSFEKYLQCGRHTEKLAYGTKYLIIHSGSRNLGKQVAEFYQKLAINLNRGYGDYLEKRDEIIRTYKEQGRRNEIQEALKQLHFQVYESETSMPEDLCYLSGKYLEEYLHDVEICQAFARRSREKMAEIILEKTGMTGGEAFHTIHNYIDTEEMILRKGAIAAHSGEKVLIPINMRDGSVLAVGRGNPEWNYSAPHGAGRLMSRTKAKNSLSLEEYKKTMEGVYTTSVNENTLDEAPMAYKSLSDIIDVIRESVDVIDVMKPVYNFKASE